MGLYQVLVDPLVCLDFLYMYLGCNAISLVLDLVSVEMQDATVIIIMQLSNCLIQVTITYIQVCSTVCSIHECSFNHHHHEIMILEKKCNGEVVPFVRTELVFFILTIWVTFKLLKITKVEIGSWNLNSKGNTTTFWTE